MELVHVDSFQELAVIPDDARAATKHVLSLLLDKIHPLILGLHNKLLSYEGNTDDIAKVRDVYTLCSSQINKCLINLFDVFKLEAHHRTSLQESRQYTIERLSWCINRLLSIEDYLKKFSESTDNNDSANDSLNVTTMYFVNWIDHTFQVLAKLSDTAYKTDYKESEQLCEQWKSEMVEYVSELHISIDELLLSAMTLCRYCLSDDQHVVKARCQVVLRETKALLSELVEGDLSTAIKATPETLKLPIMPSNVNVLIDVLKDVLYALETNTNTALLALVGHCFSYSKSPIDVLKEHFSSDSKGTCSCLVKSADEVTEDCSVVKEFDLYNERLLQIGNFAVSCSSDQHRILTLRSGLASLEALDPHLVPTLMMSPDSHHAYLLIKSWTNEVQEIRDSIYLIVDPTAFAEKSKQMMHQKLLGILKENSYNNTEVCAVINIGCMVYEFFLVYDKCEPDALPHHDKLLVLLADLNKVQKECKIVSNMLSANDDFVYKVNMPTHNKEVTVDQLLKRLKLLYTLVNRIYTLLRPKDNDDFECEIGEEESQIVYKNATHTVVKNFETYVNSPRKPSNISRSIFARTNIRSSTKNFPLSKLTSRFQGKINAELSFSVQLDRMFNESNENKGVPNETFENKALDKLRNRSHSVLYNFSPIKNRPSLRKAVLNRQCKVPMKSYAEVDNNATYDNASVMDATTSLQITDILNQMNDMTSMLSTTKLSLKTNLAGESRHVNKETKNVLRINVNNQNATVSKHIWNIPVNASIVEMPLEDSAGNVTQPSNVDTLERIHDLDYVESKLNSLKSQLETSL
ncbi:serendipity locus protein alpha-like [Anticarsia gemmatalis]|uniref:serendipity locus protein alpha-like n=1 Tax=Anticarsia gemmatalis TaxID=129554 RepID=UPI003F76F85E